MARKIMDALSSKDPAAALTALNEATH
jgi:hypothetical protein